MTELSKFAEEITVEIMSRLPPKSLMRLKCVRKSWQYLINNSNFQAKHLSVSKRIKNPSSITIVFERLIPEDIRSGKKDLILSLFDLCHGLDGDDDDHDELHPTFEDLYSPLSADQLVDCQRFCVTISNHCDGILCLTDGRKYIVLCNPAIREFKVLPVPSLYLSSSGDGFGYDLKSKDYKVVRILYNGEEEYTDGMRKLTHTVFHPPTAVVYSLLTSSWKEIKVDNLITKSTSYCIHSNNSIYLNGILYWCGYERPREVHYYSEDEDDDVSGLKDGVISFDMGNEAFHVILPPDDFCSLYRCGFGLWNEAIAFCSDRPWSSSLSKKQTREIWVMEDLGGGEGSWTKYLTFEPVVADIINQVGLFSCNKQLVMAFRTKCAVVFQEVCTNQFKRLPMKDFSDYDRALECMSVVSINGGTSLDSHDEASNDII